MVLYKNGNRYIKMDKYSHPPYFSIQYFITNNRLKSKFINYTCIELYVKKKPKFIS